MTNTSLATASATDSGTADGDAKPAAPPSIGAWVTRFRAHDFNFAAYVDLPNARVKFGISALPNSIAELNYWLSMIAQRCRNLPITRIAVKVLIPHGIELWKMELNPHVLGLSLEGFVPVRGHPLVAGIAYFGMCAEQRAPSGEHFIACYQLWPQAQLMTHKPVTEDGLRDVELFGRDSITTSDAQQVADVYSECFTGYLVDLGNIGTVTAMLQGDGIAVGVREDGRWVAIAIAEHVAIPVRGSRPVSFWEISDVATHPDYRGRGYAQALYEFLCRAIRERDPHGVITTEIRANWFPMHRIMAATGFRLSNDHGASGILPSQCVIRSTAETLHQDGEFGTLGLFYLP